jgi:hypothetical protein
MAAAVLPRNAPKAAICLNKTSLQISYPQTSEDVLAPNVACAGAANFKTNLPCRSDEQADA